MAMPYDTSFPHFCSDIKQWYIKQHFGMSHQFHPVALCSSDSFICGINSAEMRSMEGACSLRKRDEEIDQEHI
jgi:hypothetical protein